MIRDIGKIIKGIAIGLLFVVAIGAFVSGLVLTIEYEGEEFWTYLIMILGPVVSCIGPLLLYGYGELIDKVCAIKQQICGDEIELEPEPEIETDNKENRKKYEILNTNPENTDKKKKMKIEPEPEPELESIEYFEIECPRCSRQLSFQKGTTEFMCPYCECLFKEIE